MPVLNRNLYEALCDSNKEHLRSFVITDEIGSDIELGADQNPVINELIKNEAIIAKISQHKYQKEKNKAKYIIPLMTAVLILVGVALALTTFFITSSAVLPIFPILLLGFGIIEIVKVFLNIKINHHEISDRNAKNILIELDKIKRELAQDELDSGIKNIDQKITKLLCKTESQSIKFDTNSPDFSLEQSFFNQSRTSQSSANHYADVHPPISSSPN